MWSHKNLSCNKKGDDPKLLSAVAKHLCKTEGCDKERYWKGEGVTVKEYQWKVKDGNKLFRYHSFRPIKNGVKQKKVTRETSLGTLYEAGIRWNSIDPTRSVENTKNWRTFFIPFDGLR